MTCIDVSFRLVRAAHRSRGHHRPAGGLLRTVDGRGIGWAEAPQARCSTHVTGGRTGRCTPRSVSLPDLALFGEVLTDFPLCRSWLRRGWHQVRARERDR